MYDPVRWKRATGILCLIHSRTTFAQAFAKMFARETASRMEPSSQEKPSGHDLSRTAKGQPLSTFPLRAFENLRVGGDKKVPAIVLRRIRFNNKVLFLSTEMSCRVPYHELQVSANTSRRFTARLTLAAAFPISMKHRCPVQGRRGGARDCPRSTAQTPPAEVELAALH